MQQREAELDHDALVESLEVQVARRGADLERLRIQLEEELAEKHIALTRAAQREAEHQARIAALAADVRRLSVELADERNRVTTMQASLSWRVTAPLRRVSLAWRRR